MYSRVTVTRRFDVTLSEDEVVAIEAAIDSLRNRADPAGWYGLHERYYDEDQLEELHRSFLDLRAEVALP